jgi:hypothetical protein
LRKIVGDPTLAAFFVATGLQRWIATVAKMADSSASPAEADSVSTCDNFVGHAIYV